MATRRSPAKTPETGSGTISTVLGVLVFLVLLLLAVQVLTGLYATSVVTAVTFDAVRQVAVGTSTKTMATDERNSEALARRRLSGFREVGFVWNDTPDSVGLYVTARKPGFLPRSLAVAGPSDTIVRTVWVRKEMLR